MSAIILSIKPHYVNLILAGKKTYEYRKKIPKKDIDIIYIYSSSPVKKIVASVKVLGCLKESPMKVWELTNMFSGISFENYCKYFSENTEAYAYKLGKVNRFVKPLLLKELGINFAPQSFRYVDREMFEQLEMYDAFYKEK